MIDLEVYCPRCNAACYSGKRWTDDLMENITIEGMTATCHDCGCSFMFEVRLEISNKIILPCEPPKDEDMIEDRKDIFELIDNPRIKMVM
jgi:hypothetical protein